MLQGRQAVDEYTTPPWGLKIAKETSRKRRQNIRRLRFRLVTFR